MNRFLFASLQEYSKSDYAGLPFIEHIAKPLETGEVFFLSTILF